MSIDLWRELRAVLDRPKLRKYFTEEKVLGFLDELVARTEWVSVERKHKVCRDPKDNMLLDLATSGHADCIVSGDDDLLVLDPFEGIRILTSAAFLEIA